MNWAKSSSCPIWIRVSTRRSPRPISCSTTLLMGGSTLHHGCRVSRIVGISPNSYWCQRVWSPVALKPFCGIITSVQKKKTSCVCFSFLFLFLFSLILIFLLLFFVVFVFIFEPLLFFFKRAKTLSPPPLSHYLPLSLCVHVISSMNLTVHC